MSADRLIPRLLARRDRLGRVEKAAILDSVLAGVAPRRRARWWIAIATPALVTAISVFLIAPWRSQAPRSEFGSRGGTRAVASLHTVCAGAGACARGHKLLFDLQGTMGYRYFAAFSKRADGTVLWYFPALPEGVGIDLAIQTQDGVLDRGIILGEEHATGTYRVYGVFSRTPLTRQTIRDGFDEAHHAVGPETDVITTELVVR